jgi:ABC-2 type transport system permease protein
MRNLYAIYRKEMGHYFVSPVAYIVIGVFLILCAIFFNLIYSAIVQRAFQQSMQSMQYGGAVTPMDVPSLVLRNFFSVMGSLLLFLTPMLTMGIYSEERKRGTMELLMTSPVSDAEIVLGKFLAMLSLFMLMLLPTLIYISYMYLHSDPAAPWKLVWGGYLGAILLGGSLLAIGAFISSLTENQLIAAVLTWGVFLILWVIDAAAQGAGETFGAIFGYLSVLRHYDDFTHGVVDTTALIFYGSLIVLGLFLTMRSIDAMRWRHA